MTAVPQGDTRSVVLRWIALVERYESHSRKRWGRALVIARTRMCDDASRPGEPGAGRAAEANLYTERHLKPTTVAP